MGRTIGRVAVHRRRPPRGPGPPGSAVVAAAPVQGGSDRVGRPRPFTPGCARGRGRVGGPAHFDCAGRAWTSGHHRTRAPEGTGTGRGEHAVKLSAVIMAHPVRKDSAERVRESLDRDVEIVYDEVAEPSKDPRQRWAVGKRAWEDR